MVQQGTPSEADTAEGSAAIDTTEEETAEDAQATAYFRENVPVLVNREASIDQRAGIAQVLSSYAFREENPPIPAEFRAPILQFVDETFASIEPADDDGPLYEAIIAILLLPVGPTTARLQTALDLLQSHPANIDGLFVRGLLLRSEFPPYRTFLETTADAILAEAPREFDYGDGPYLRHLARLAGVDAIARIERFAASDWPAPERFQAVEALDDIEGPEAVAALTRIASITGVPHVTRRIGEALVSHDAAGGVLLMAEAIGDPEDRYWMMVEGAAAVELATLHAARRWSAGAPSTSLRECHLAQLRAAGYEVGDLSEGQAQLEELLRAAADPEWLTCRIAWSIFIDVVGQDPSEGLFWSVVVQHEGSIEETSRPPRSAPPEYQAALRASQVEHLANALQLVRHSAAP